MQSIAIIIPTRDRTDRLALTLDQLARLWRSPSQLSSVRLHAIVIDNASAAPIKPGDLPFETTVRRLELNEGSAARNVGVAIADPSCEWVVMLDDDSAPVDLGFISRLDRQPANVAAVSADLWLPGLRRRETGGLPEVFIHCGVAIRRRAFLEVGGLDPTFESHADEYDLAARMIGAGYKVAHDPWFRVEHRTTPAEFSRGLSNNGDAALSKLVRNNGWLIERYAPDECRRERWREVRARYRERASQTGARQSLAFGLQQYRQSRASQTRTPLNQAQFDRFTGLSHARQSLHDAWQRQPFATARIVDPGRNAWAVRHALSELGVRELTDRDSHTPDALVIGTMAPGPMLDAFERRQAIAIMRGMKHGVDGPQLIAPWQAIMNRQRPLHAADALRGMMEVNPSADRHAATSAGSPPFATLNPRRATA